MPPVELLFAVLGLILQLGIAVRISLLLKRPASYFRLFAACTVAVVLASLSIQSNQLGQITLVLLASIGAGGVMLSVGSVLLLIDAAKVRRIQSVKAPHEQHAP